MNIDKIKIINPDGSEVITSISKDLHPGEGISIENDVISVGKIPLIAFEGVPYTAPILSVKGTPYVDEFAVSASNEYFPAVNAVDGPTTDASCWAAISSSAINEENPEYYNMFFSKFVCITNIEFTNRIHHNSTVTMSEFTLQVTTDGNNWEDVQAYTNNNNDSGGVWSIVVDNRNQKGGKGWRLKITKSRDTYPTDVNIGSMVISGLISDSNTSTSTTLQDKVLENSQLLSKLENNFIIQKTDSSGALVLDGESINVKETVVVDNAGNEKTLPAKTISAPTDEGNFLVLYNDSEETYECLYGDAIKTVVVDTPPILTADGVPYVDEYAVSASSNQSSGYQSYLVTNGTSTSKTDCWSSGSPLLSEGSPIYFNMYFKDPTRVGRIDFINRASGGDNPSPPTEFVLQGSKTNVVGEETWIDIQSYTNSNTEFSGEWSIFISVSKRDYYYGYRFKIINSSSGSYVDIASITPGTTTEEYVSGALSIHIDQDTGNYAVFKPNETDGTYVQIPEYTTPPLGFGVVNTKLELHSFGVGSTTYKYPKSDIRYILINDTEEQPSTEEILTNIVATDEEYLDGTSETKVPNVKQISDDLHTIEEAIHISLPDSVIDTAPILTSNGTPYVDAFAVSASSEHSGGYFAWKLFTGGTVQDGGWHSVVRSAITPNNPEYYNMYFRSQQKLTSFTVTNRFTNVINAVLSVKAFTLQGSKTNVVGEEEWIDIQNYTNDNNTSNTEWSIHIGESNQDYYYGYRFKITESYGTTAVNIGAISFISSGSLYKVKDVVKENSITVNDLETLIYIGSEYGVSWEAPVLTSNGEPLVDEYAVDISAAEYSNLDTEYTLTSKEDGEWHSAQGIEFPVYFNMTFKNNYRMNGLYFKNRTYNTIHGYAIKDFTVEGSVKGTVWDTIYTGTNTNNTPLSEWGVSFENTKSYKYYRLVIYSTIGTSEYLVMTSIIPIGEIVEGLEPLKDVVVDNYIKIEELFKQIESLTERVKALETT